MLKEEISVLLIVVLFVFSLGVVSATGVTLSGDTVGVSSASNLYAYEIKMKYTGTPTGATFDGFLGAGTSSGYNVRGGYLYVYESKLDAAKIGVSGSNDLFDVAPTGSITMVDSALFIDNTGAEESVTYCGDGTCSSALGETTSTCSADCPTATVTPAGGGSSGGSGSTTTPIQLSPLPDLVVVPEELNINAISEESVERKVTIINSRTEGINLEIVLEGFGEAATASPSSVYLAPGEQKEITLRINVAEKGLMTGKVRFKSGTSIVAESTVVVNVMSENFLFDSSISLLRQYRVISFGKNLIAQIDLQQVGPQEKVDVVASYIVKDFAGNSYLEDSETFYVLGDKSFTKEFHTADLVPGKYVLGLEIVYPGAFATSSVQFEVVEKKDLVSSLIGGDMIIIAGLVAGILVIVLAIVRVVRRGKKRRKHRR